MNSTSTEVQGGDPSLENIRVLAYTIWSFTASLGIPANIFVLASIVYFRDMRTISNVYIFNLALADLLFLAGIPVSILGQSASGGWVLGPTLCKMYISGNAVSQFASAVFIAILSFDRFMAVCRPIASTAWRTTQAAFALSVSAWVMVILEMTPLLLFVKLIKISAGPSLVKNSCMLFFGDEKHLDFSDDTVTEEQKDAQMTLMEESLLVSRRFFLTYTFTLSYLLPLVAVWLFYVRIIRKMYRRRQQMFMKRSVTKRRTTKVTIMGLAIVISYTVCWFPFWLSQWSIEMDVGLNKNRVAIVYVSYLAFALQYINSAANPFLYVFLSDSFKRNVSRLMQSKAKETIETARRPSNQPTESTKMLSHNNNNAMLVSIPKATTSENLLTVNNV